tara:strand:+ start:231 stop:359 length:129 start_codon:yes stop_codon:yes gene_type:complete
LSGENINANIDIVVTSKKITNIEKDAIKKNINFSLFSSFKKG